MEDAEKDIIERLKRTHRQDYAEHDKKLKRIEASLEEARFMIEKLKIENHRLKSTLIEVAETANKIRRLVDGK